MMNLKAGVSHGITSLITAKISACTAVSYLFVKESQSDGTAYIKEIPRQLNSVSSLYAEVLEKVLMKLNLSVKRMIDFLVILVILQGSMTLF